MAKKIGPVVKVKNIKLLKKRMKEARKAWKEVNKIAPKFTKAWDKASPEERTEAGIPPAKTAGEFFQDLGLSSIS